MIKYKLIKIITHIFLNIYFVNIKYRCRKIYPKKRRNINKPNNTEVIKLII